MSSTPHRSRSSSHALSIEHDVPSVMIVVSLYNESSVVAEKVQNFRALNYPVDRIALAVGLDGCDDGTEAALEPWLNTRILSFSFSERQGKTTVLNKILAATTSDIVVFTDANAMFKPDAVRELVRPFSDPKVGLVSGRRIISGSDDDAAVHNWYYDWLAKMRQLESASGSIVGADGAIYAMRRGMIEPLAPAFINDLTHPIQVVLQGSRAVVAPEALIHEGIEDWSFRREFHRQVRMAAQAMHVIVSFTPSLLSGRHYGYLARLYLAKVFRFLLPVTLVTCVVAATLLSFPALTAAKAIAILSLSVFLASFAAVVTSVRVLRPFAYFVVVGAAYSVGVYKWAVGERFVTWQPRMG